MSYTTATFTRLFATNDGRGVIELTYTGNAGETPVVQEYPQDLAVMPSADYMRGIAMDKLSKLNATKNFLTGAAPFLGTILDTTTPLPSTASTFGSFVAASAPFTPGATPTDVATIFGSATRKVTVTRVAIATLQTTAGINTWSLIKRSAANSGGTSTPITKVPLDSNFPAATATVLQYSANPSPLGSVVGNVWSGRVAAPAPASVVGECLQTVPLDFGQPVALSGIAQGLALNFGGIALPPGLSVIALFNWTEQ